MTWNCGQCQVPPSKELNADRSRPRDSESTNNWTASARSSLPVAGLGSQWESYLFVLGTQLTRSPQMAHLPIQKKAIPCPFENKLSPWEPVQCLRVFPKINSYSYSQVCSLNRRKEMPSGRGTSPKGHSKLGRVAFRCRKHGSTDVWSGCPNNSMPSIP